MANGDILEKIQKYRTISIIGMDKNVGKTTVLNHVINEARGKLSLGLTSIGRDGEDKDRVTFTEKPRIYIEKGTYIATAKQCLNNSDITREIVRTTGISTPMGEVIIVKALSDGHVELGGPSINSYISSICTELIYLGSQLIIVDGALSRKTSASPAITEATILSTGASLSKDIEKVAEKTAYTVKLLSLAKVENREIIKLCSNIRDKARITLINKDKSIKDLGVITSLDASKDIIENLNDEVDYIFIRGIVSDKLLMDIIKSTDKYKDVTFIAEDGTKIFINEDTLYRFERQGGKLKVLDEINLICVTCNPKSPFGYGFDREKLLYKLREIIKLPVYDVVGGD